MSSCPFLWANYNLQKSLFKSLNTELFLKDKSVVEKMCNESSCLESSKNEDEGGQGDIEIYEDKHHLFSFADKNYCFHQTV